MIGKTCGSCTACCKTHPVREIDKPAGTWCRHRQKGRGCRIYAERPEGCRAFRCQWLLSDMEESLRPDRTDIVVDAIEHQLLGMTMLLFEVVRGALRSRFAQDVIGAYRAEGLPLAVVPVEGDVVLYVRRGRLLPGVKVSLDNLRPVRVVEE